jgi:tetratricopeptide (TPR) repeat protein
MRQRLVKWGRRHPSLVAATGVVLLLAVAGLAISNVFVGRARLDAVNAASVADTRRAEADQAVNDMYVEVAEEWLRDQPALEEKQRSFAEKALKYYERRVREERDNPKLQAAVATSLYRMAVIHDRLGDLRKGNDAYTQAADIFGRLAAENPNNAAYRYWQAHSLAEHGDLCDRLGKGVDAERLARQAFQLFEQAQNEFPNDIRIRAGLADCCVVLGTVNFMPGPQYMNFEVLPDSSPRRWKESVELLRRALTLYPTVVAIDPEQCEYRWRFHRVQSILSKMPTLSFVERVQLVNDSVAGLEALVKAYPRKHRPRAELCEALNRRGWVLLWGARGPAMAETNYRGALTIADKLVEEYPTVPYYLTLQAGTRAALGRFLVVSDRSNEGESLLTLAASARDATPDGHVPPWFFTSVAAHAYQWLGFSHVQGGRLDEAEKAYRQALALRRQVASDYPKSGTWWRVRFGTDRVAEVLSRKGSNDDAIALYRDNIDFWKRQATLRPSNPLVLRAHAFSHYTLGYWLQMQDAWEQADQAYGAALDAHDRLEKSGLLNQGSDDRWKGLDEIDWQWQQRQRAWLYAKAGRPGDAEKAFREVVRRAFRDLDAAPPGSPARRGKVASVMRDEGWFLNRIGRRHESIVAYDKAIKQADKWAVEFPSEYFHQDNAINWRIELAFVHQVAGNAAEANRAVDEAITIQRKKVASGRPMPLAWLAVHLGNQGLIRWRTGRDEDAVSAGREAVEIIESLVTDPSHTGAVRLQIENRLAFATTRLADLFERTGHFAEAETAYRKTVALRRGLAEAVVLGEGIGAGADLSQDVSKYVRTTRDWADSLIALALFHLRHGQTVQATHDCAQARSICEQMAAAYPEDDDGLRALALFLATCPVETIRDPTEAVRCARKAVAFAENSFNAAALGAAQFTAGDFRAAVANLDRAMRLQNKRPDTIDLFFRAMADWQLGNTEAARRYYDEAVRQMELPQGEGEAILHMLREEAAALLGVK